MTIFNITVSRKYKMKGIVVALLALFLQTLSGQTIAQTS
jgi:hypothetical protein